eukprot:TRINITY_DN10092_c0_g1_i8.p1 TRINITY_DN10092_c0_g1~~TRINITY_DN10092_c0_g1_i8.p1  ORF type:complete len:379 (+),score=67.17 TRINITY_DN10092_c0_g1_i8:140-1276(+)
MRAVVYDGFGGPEVLKVREVPVPECDPQSECLIKVEATALNRADIMQRKGRYPPPKGVTDIPGLECAGYLLNSPSDLKNTSYRSNRRVMAILQGGGYSTVVKTHLGGVMEIPKGLSFEQAAAIPETWITAYQLINWLGDTQRGDYVLVHAGASGVGTSAIQLIKSTGAHAIAVCSSESKIKVCKDLGAAFGVNYKEEKEFSKAVMELTSKHGADVILDPVFGSHYPENLKSLADEGRWIVYAFMGGAKVADMNAPKLFSKKATMKFTTIRMRTQEYRDKLVKEFAEKTLPKFESGELKPIIDKVLPMSQAAEAQKRMEKNENIGKIILRMDICISSNPVHTPYFIVGVLGFWGFGLSLIHICRCRRIERCRSRWSPYH